MEIHGLTVRERRAIKQRNPGNEDVKKLLQEYDRLMAIIGKLSETEKDREDMVIFDQLLGKAKEIPNE